VTEGWRKLHNKELYNFYSSASIIAVIKPMRWRWAGHVAPSGEKRNAYRILVRKPERNRPLGRPRSRLVNNIERDVREIGWDIMDWMDLAQDRDRWTVINFDFIHFWSVTLVNTIKTTSFTPPSVIKLYLYVCIRLYMFRFLGNHLQKAYKHCKENYHYMIYNKSN
jgi:hypothetical protein